VETQHNVGYRDTFFCQDLGDCGFRSIVLDPDFAVFDVEVKDEAENTFLVFPPNVGELVMVMFAIANNLSLYIVGMAVGMGLFCEYLPNYLPILLQLIHTLIFSCDRHSIKTARDYDPILAQVRQWMLIANLIQPRERSRLWYFWGLVGGDLIFR
jgi:hypothetical protein